MRGEHNWRKQVRLRYYLIKFVHSLTYMGTAYTSDILSRVNYYFFVLSEMSFCTLPWGHKRQVFREEMFCLTWLSIVMFIQKLLYFLTRLSVVKFVYRLLWINEKCIFSIGGMILSEKREESAVPVTPFPIWVPTLTGLSLNPFLRGKRPETKHQRRVNAKLLKKMF
jgi:hypothetical protein